MAGKAGNGRLNALPLGPPLTLPGAAVVVVVPVRVVDTDDGRPSLAGIQGRSAPYRVIHVGVLEIGPEPRRFRCGMANPHGDLDAQVQLDLGCCAPETTVWLSDVTVRALGSGD